SHLRKRRYPRAVSHAAPARRQTAGTRLFFHGRSRRGRTGGNRRLDRHRRPRRPMTDFWRSCGHQLLDRDEGGGLRVSDEFLKAYLARPELVPPPDACAAERELHEALFADPRRPVDTSDIAVIADADARENWQLLITFRDRLLNHKTLEAAYVDLCRKGFSGTPPLFINQLVHAILR